MAPIYESELLILLSALGSAVPGMLMSIASYVLSAVAIYTIARRRGLRKPWLAWVPVVNCWLLGSLSDQYHYVVKRENKSKRKVLLVLNILSAVFSAVIAVLAVQALTTVFGGSYRYEAELLRRVWHPLMGILGLCLPLVGVGIAEAVIRYMALYDVYKSLDPANSVMYLVLSIVFRIPEPFFLFFNRNKDLGMPPRRPEPAYTEPWESENKDYL